MSKKKQAAKRKRTPAKAAKAAKAPAGVGYPGEPVWPGDEESDAPEAPTELVRRHDEEEAAEPEGFDANELPHNFGDRQDDESHELPEGDEPHSELRLGDDKPAAAWRPSYNSRGRRKTKGER